MRGGEPGYQIAHDAAWDFLEREDALDGLAVTCDAVCFGSLAQRSARSRETIRAFLAAATQAVRLYDVNLRRNTLTHEPGYSLEILERSCEVATMVKVNGDELFEIAGLFGGGTKGVENDDWIPEVARGLMRKLSIPALIVTRGAKGTALFNAKGEFHGRIPLVALTDVHPVGAGDACTAGILFGSVLGFSPDDAVDLGNKMGAWVASHRSATPQLSEGIVRFVEQLARGHGVREGGLLVEKT